MTEMDDHLLGRRKSAIGCGHDHQPVFIVANSLEIEHLCLEGVATRNRRHRRDKSKDEHKKTTDCRSGHCYSCQIEYARSHAAYSASSMSPAARRIIVRTQSSSLAVTVMPFRSRNTSAATKAVRLLPSTKG